MMLTQRLLARDLFEDIAPMVLDSGVCATTDTGRATILKFLDLSCFNLHKRLDSEGTLMEWYVPVQNGCFALPQECREARQIGINGIPLRQRSEFYIGKVITGCREGGCAPWECRDLGDFYLPEYLPKQRGIRIALVAMDGGDAGKEVVVQVTNEYGQPVKETLTLRAEQEPVIMDSVAYDVTYFKKPKTVGNVRLQLHYDDGQRLYFANYHPDTEEGLFRRKQLPRCHWGCQVARIIGKVRYIQITQEDQIIPYNDPIAVGFACAATAAWRRRDTAAYAENMLLALQELKKQMEDGSSPANVRQINVRTYAGNPSLAGNFKRWS
jgi:hypothetical protein